MKIAMGSDHTGVEYRQEIAKFVKEKFAYEIIDFGPYSGDSCDYPVFGAKVARAVASGEADLGIAICGTGIGIGISCNKVRGIRCCTCSEPYSARLSRQHNNSNVLSFGARVVGLEMAKMIVDEWLSAEYEGGRHQRRIDLVAQIEAEEEADNAKTELK